MNRETEYFLNQLKDMETLKRQGKDIGALARNNVERILWQSVEKRLDDWSGNKNDKAKKRVSITKHKVR